MSSELKQKVMETHTPTKGPPKKRKSSSWEAGETPSPPSSPLPSSSSSPSPDPSPSPRVSLSPSGSKDVIDITSERDKPKNQNAVEEKTENAQEKKPRKRQNNSASSTRHSKIQKTKEVPKAATSTQGSASPTKTATKATPMTHATSPLCVASKIYVTVPTSFRVPIPNMKEDGSVDPSLRRDLEGSMSICLEIDAVTGEVRAFREIPFNISVNAIPASASAEKHVLQGCRTDPQVSMEIPDAAKRMRKKRRCWSTLLVPRSKDLHGEMVISLPCKSKNLASLPQNDWRKEYPIGSRCELIEDGYESVGDESIPESIQVAIRDLEHRCFELTTDPISYQKSFNLGIEDLKKNLRTLMGAKNSHGLDPSAAPALQRVESRKADPESNKILPSSNARALLVGT